MPDPYYADNSTTVYAGDCLEVLSTLPDNSVDAVCTDPPYGLEFMGKDWDSFKNANDWGRAGDTAPWKERPKGGNDPFQADRPRFHAGRPFQAWCELWATECLRILKPGGHLLAFGGTRTAHRLACAIEDAGFEIRDSIAWLYGSGFPKSRDVSKAIDAEAGAEREILGYDSRHINRPRTDAWEKSGQPKDDFGMPGETQSGQVFAVTAPATDAARQWQGWGTALKPAHEPIIVARKPVSGTIAANVLRWGTGALNIDAARIGDEPLTAHGGGPSGAHRIYNGDKTRGQGIPPQAAGSNPRTGRWPANVVLDEHAAQELDQQSGELVSGSGIKAPPGKTHGFMDGRQSERTDTDKVYEGSTSGASRFFYTSKASTDERITHNGTAHPTVKPLDLMRWLVRLVTPPGGIILEPFAGSGTTVEAALLEGFRCIAIERELDYLPLITQRINRRRDPIAYITAAGEDLGLFGEVPA